MRILSFIEDPDVIKKILKHLGLWDIKARAPPKRANAPPPDIHAEYSHSQVPLCEDHLYYDPDYPIETYASWFFQNQPWDLMEWFVRFMPKSRQFPRMSNTWSHGRSSSHFPKKPLNRNSVSCPDVVVILFLTNCWHFGIVSLWKSKFLSPYHQIQCVPRLEVNEKGTIA